VLVSISKSLNWLAMMALAASGTVRAVSTADVAAAPPAAVKANVDIKATLEAMLASDQRYRDEIMQQQTKLGPKAPEVQALWSKQNAIDAANLATLRKIVDAAGWPKQSVVGDDAAGTAFLVVQHADLATQEHFLPVIRQAVQAGEAKPGRLALLQDRVLIGEGKPQIYGTQLHSDASGKLAFSPIEDEAHVDQRRASAGLGPIADYAKYFGIEYVPPKASAP
jgi:hypothetical protein